MNMGASHRSRIRNEWLVDFGSLAQTLFRLGQYEIRIRKKAGFEVSQHLPRRDVRGVLADILVLDQRFSQEALSVKSRDSMLSVVVL